MFTVAVGLRGNCSNTNTTELNVYYKLVEKWKKFRLSKQICLTSSSDNKIEIIHVQKQPLRIRTMGVVAKPRAAISMKTLSSTICENGCTRRLEILCSVYKIIRNLGINLRGVMNDPEVVVSMETRRTISSY